MVNLKFQMVRKYFLGREVVFDGDRPIRPSSESEGYDIKNISVKVASGRKSLEAIQEFFEMSYYQIVSPKYMI